jgi:chemosensory pili system protein ChpA (sensor histidine kinase/response regulator)
MSIAQKNFALDWTRRELDQTLTEAREALEAYAESDRDKTLLRTCVTALHQVHGTLLMLELSGVTLLSEELEQLAQALLGDVVGEADVAQQVLMQGILLLPACLERIQRGHADSSGVVLPLANQAREARGLTPLPHAPQNGASVREAAQASVVKFEEIDGAGKLQRIRAAYQLLLLSILRGEDRNGATASLGKVALGLQRICAGTPAVELWRAFGLFAQGLAQPDSSLDGAAVKLLRRVDAELKGLASGGREALERPAAADLVASLLDAARDRGIEEPQPLPPAPAIADESVAVIPGAEALQAAARAMRDELATLKDQVDLAVRAGTPALDELKSLIAPLQQIGSTLELLGLDTARPGVIAQVAALGALDRQDEIDEAALMSLAAMLLELDDALTAVIDAGGYTHAQPDEAPAPIRTVVLNEARERLEQVKQAVVAYVSSQWQSARLQEVPAQLASVEGALAMLGLDEPAAMTGQCRRYVEQDLLQGRTPDWNTLDSFADAISGIDYYLERLSEGSLAVSGDILKLVERSLASLVAFAADPDQRLHAPRASRPERPAVPTWAVDGSGHGAADVEALAQRLAEEDSSAALASISAATAPLAVAPGSSAPQPSSRGLVGPSSATDADPEIVQIFVEEVGEILADVEARLPIWRGSKDDVEMLGEVRRAFHTLKGSSRLVGAGHIGELAWSIENLLNGAKDGTVTIEDHALRLIESAVPVLRQLADAFGAGIPAALDIGWLVERADLLASGGELDDLATAGVEPSPAQPGIPPPVAEHATDFGDETSRLFVAEARSHIAHLERYLERAYPEARIDDAVLRALHTLRGSSGTARVDTINRIASALNRVVSAAYATGRPIGSELQAFLRRGVDMLAAGIECIDCGDSYGDDISVFEAEGERIFDSIAPPPSTDASLLDLGGAQGLLNAASMLQAWHAGALDGEAFSDTVAALHDLRNEAELQAQTEVSALCDGLLAAYEQLEDRVLSLRALEILTQAHELLLTTFDRLAAEQRLPEMGSVLDELESVGAVGAAPGESPKDEPSLALLEEQSEDLEDGESDFVLELLVPAEEPEVDELSLEALDEPDTVELGLPVIELEAEPSGPGSYAQEAAVPAVGDGAATTGPETPAELFVLPQDGDEEILALFLEEADELLESIDHGIHDWSRERANGIHLENLLRCLHTLKGGARLAGLSELGGETHAFESFLIAAQRQQAFPDAFFASLQIRFDALAVWVAALRSANAEPPRAQTATAAPVVAHVMSSRAVAPREMPEPVTAASAEPSAHAIAAAEPVSSGGEPPAEARAAQEMVRVSAALLEQLVNVAGESSIVRSRIEQGVGDFAGALEEMETTIERVREQLRRLEIQTEAQVLFRSQHGAGPDYEEFDPLEMDRYSQLQELSRALAESASDMLDLKETLTLRARESETLLLQQARLNTELQEGLMRTRMVPFSRLLPRLRRIVRQVADEIGKKVEFNAFNMEGELDRNVLERMVPPLEHMLRNAVDHGLEHPYERHAAGKSEAGRIDLRLTREGADVLIEVIDDGHGIDPAQVREKAIERGLIDGGQRVSDDAALQFIFAPGFSTARTITQISGRGVGMDVVHTTVKQLGGSIAIHSEKGRGTCFSIRLPFTVSVNRALMVAVADDPYAIPLNAIEGIVRLPIDELEEITSQGGAFEYAGAPYRMRYLGHYLGREYVPRAEQSSVPLVLVRSGEIAVALHVDAVQGSREIVVKSLGPQFAGVSGISGATILGDGSVVVILDLVALVRSQAESPRFNRSRAQPAADRPICVMVVDDSVTVRKVTSRLLERQGMDVIVAKDGVEAMALLQEQRPDIVLLDIEMPRMDGFEVARQVRRDDRLSQLPIVMVSSRTGIKHQERAIELGVSRFLGKPFQESELLSMIAELVDR